MEKTFVPGRVGIISLGLMGGSFAKAFAAAGVEVYGRDISEDVLEMAEIETIKGELTDEIVPTCELIVLAGYPKVAISELKRIAPLVSPGAIVMDTGGVKKVICDACFPVAENHPFTFVGCHPMAGTQYSGFAHARANMFHGAPLVIVPPKMDDFERLDLLERMKQLLAPLGFATFTLTTAERHDEIIAFTSQLAHVVSNAYVKSPEAKVHKGFSAGSYKDLTRVARLNPDMWTELFLEDADNLSREIGCLIGHLQEYKDAIDARDSRHLRELLADGDRRKREIEGR
ncbi:MAG: prephenate dehydrogenase [Coriobacteriaceae bacterium]|jgi:prephenate dehydrogenase|nr:prephenate dehydrogenase [Atopobium sp.]MCH4081046.1 prephenate dehydrogenase [Atopobiaceae bacterium]MDD5843902.1 prephenate dehydrogenase [Olsenella sp.]RRF94403.1 MAG: prephenate dehydrogenase [Coriobacteriaceae bacterium]MCI1344148.1 prephenate dehydrogenase [Atopobiaceae bacterium]